MSWVRERSSSAAVDQAFVGAPDFEIAPRDRFDASLNTDSVNSTNQFQISVEPQRPSRRNLLASMALGLVVGVVLPIAFCLPLFRTTSGSAAELPSDAGIRISVSSDTANLTVDTKNVALAREIRGGQEQAAPEAPSNNAQFVSEQAVSLQPREYLSIRGEQRLYQPEIVLEPVDGHGKAVKVGADDLKILPGSGGRYRASSSNAEWQGSWSFDNSQKNLKLGSAYADYLDKSFDSTFSNKLSVINSQPSNLLSNVERNTAGPSGLKR